MLGFNIRISMMERNAWNWIKESLEQTALYNNCKYSVTIIPPRRDIRKYYICTVCTVIIKIDKKIIQIMNRNM